jgi:prepilin-type N-terminal cleavage/methylation domain-containing protein
VSTAAAGFSLLELVVALSLVGLLLGLAFPGYSAHLSNQRAADAARGLVSDLRVAQQEAVTRRVPIAVTFSAADPSCAAGPAASYVLAQDVSVIKRTCLPAGVDWAPLPKGRLIFKTTGGAQGPLHLDLRTARTGRQHAVSVEAETGAITSDVR